MTKTTNLILTALFTALTATGAMLSLPLPLTPVPVTLATLACMLAGAFLGPKYGSLSQIIYILLGAIGIPVFHNFTAGFGIIAGPTGGYLLGYIASAFCTGLILKNTIQPAKIISACVLGTFSCYLFGTCWFMLSTGSSLSAALVSCVIPFLPGDILKILAAILLIRRLKPIITAKVMLK